MLTEKTKALMGIKLESNPIIGANEYIDRQTHQAADLLSGTSKYIASIFKYVHYPSNDVDYGRIVYAHQQAMGEVKCDPEELMYNYKLMLTYVTIFTQALSDYDTENEE